MIKSIKTQLMVAVSVLIGAGIGCMMILLYLGNYHLVRTNLEDQFLKQAQILANGFDIHMQREKTVVTAFAKQATPQFSLLATDVDQAHIFVKKMHDDFPQWDPVTFFPDITGKTAITSLTKVVDASRLEYIASFPQGKPFFADPIVSIVHGRPIVVGVAPIVMNGQVVGAMAGGMRIDIFTKEIAAAKVGTNGFAILVSPNGTITSHPHSEWILQKKLADLNNSDLTQALQAIHEGRSGTRITEMNGQPHLVAYTPTMDGWGIFVVSPAQEEFAAITRLGWIFFGIFLLGWLLTFLSIRQILDRRFTGPVAHLAAAMRKLPQESTTCLDHPLAVEAPNDQWPQELRDLHIAYQNMATQIQLQLKTILSTNEKYAKAFRHSSDVIGLVRSQDEHFIELSDAFFATFDYSPQEVLEHSSREFRLWEDPEKRRDFFQKAARGEKIHRLETVWLTRSGEKRLGLLSIEIIELEHERYHLFVWQDITELKRSEQALLQMNAELEKNVAQRTRELSFANTELTALNEEMIAMNETLESANEKLIREVDERKNAEDSLSVTNQTLQTTLEKLQQTQSQMIESEKMAALGSLVAGVAHEINTPLGNCVTLASHLHLSFKKFLRSMGKDPPSENPAKEFIEDGSELFESLESNLERTSQLIRSFRSVATSQIQEDRQYFYVAPYLEQVALTLQPLLKKTQLHWLIDCPDTLRWDSFPGVLSQILTHLVMNSITHGYDLNSTGNLFCSLREENNEIVMEYRDDGRGMNPDTLAKAFDPFFTTNRGTGSGLGLYTVYNLVTQKLAGTITCSSAPGAGTRFVLKAPRTQPKERM